VRATGHENRAGTYLLWRTFTFAARDWGDEALRIARRCRLESLFTRPALFRVDLRDGLPLRESSRSAPPLRSARRDTFLRPLRPPPTLRSVALTPGKEVSTVRSRRVARGFFARAGRAARCWATLNRSALVAMARPSSSGRVANPAGVRFARFTSPGRISPRWSFGSRISHRWFSGSRVLDRCFFPRTRSWVPSRRGRQCCNPYRRHAVTARRWV
jgi:hypothetical protein